MHFDRFGNVRSELEVFGTFDMLRFMDRREAGDAVFADERQARIAELVSAHGRVHNGELARQFDVSEPTIRKDLSALQRRGLVKRTHGGAIALHPVVDRELAAREATQPDAKQRDRPRLPCADRERAVDLPGQRHDGRRRGRCARRRAGQPASQPDGAHQHDRRRARGRGGRSRSSTSCWAGNCGWPVDRSPGRSRCTSCGASPSTWRSSA